MSEADRAKWNQRYSSMVDEPLAAPSKLLEEHISLAPVGHALDLACGRGRNALFMAEHGFAVDAVDIAQAGLEIGRRVAAAKGLTINWQCKDLLDDIELPVEQYELIVLFHFVAPKLLTQLPCALVRGGLIIVEQHLQTEAIEIPASVEVVGPSSQQFRVAPGALQTALSELERVYSFEGVTTSTLTGNVDEQRVAALAQWVARKPL